MNRIQKILVTEWLGEELDGACLHRANGHWNIAMRSDEDDGNVNIGCRQLVLKVQAAKPWQSDIENKTAGDIGHAVHASPETIEKLLGGSKEPDFKADRPQQILQRVPHGLIIVHNEYAF